MNINIKLHKNYKRLSFGALCFKVINITLNIAYFA
jgi:hypothetical protein